MAFVMLPRAFLCLLFCAPVGLAACIEVPELDRAVPDWVDDADYPALVNLDGLQSSEPLPEDEATALEDSLNARAGRLKRRARDLNAQAVN